MPRYCPSCRHTFELWELYGGQPDHVQLGLKDVGCSSGGDTVSLGEARSLPGAFGWTAHLSFNLAIGLAITLALTLAVYGLVRAIGWVIKQRVRKPAKQKDYLQEAHSPAWGSKRASAMRWRASSPSGLNVSAVALTS